jgi:hypothetical protein
MPRSGGPLTHYEKAFIVASGSRNALFERVLLERYPLLALFFVTVSEKASNSPSSPTVVGV